MSGPAVLRRLAWLTRVAVVATSVAACHQVHLRTQSPHAVPTIRRETSFVPAPRVGGSPLVTDRAVKLAAADEEALLALGGVKLGVLHVHVVDRVDPTEDEWTHKVVWPGASIDAAALGATHARKISLEVPQRSPFDCRFRRTPCEGPSMTKAVKASYELWHVAPERWAELPEGLRPKALPASAIRDVQPGNWVRPPPAVTVRNE